MKRLTLPIYLAVLYAIGLVSCVSETEQYNNEIAETDTVMIDSSVYVDTRPKSTFTVYNEDGSEVTLTESDSTMFCSMATWCPYSKALVEAINDPDLNPLTKKFPIVFLFSKDEAVNMYERIKKDPAESGAETEEEAQSILDKLADRAAKGKLVFPEMLLDLPDNVQYYYFDDKLDVHGFPNVYNNNSLSFDMSPVKWYTYHDDENSNLIAALLKKMKL